MIPELSNACHNYNYKIVKYIKLYKYRIHEKEYF